MGGTGKQKERFWWVCQEHKSSTSRAQPALLLVQAPTSGIYPGKKRKNGSNVSSISLLQYSSSFNHFNLRN